MDDRKQCMQEKLSELKQKQAHAAREAERNRLMTELPQFSGKYRFAAADELARTEAYLSKLHFTSPAHIEIACELPLTPHQNMYLCFLCGTMELSGTVVCGKWQDLRRDLEIFQYFSPYLLLIDEDFCRYIYINDAGTITESALT